MQQKLPGKGEPRETCAQDHDVVIMAIPERGCHRLESLGLDIKIGGNLRSVRQKHCVKTKMELVLHRNARNRTFGNFGSLKYQESALAGRRVKFLADDGTLICAGCANENGLSSQITH